MKLATNLFFLVLILPSVAKGEIGDFDGHEWFALNESQKTMLTLGFIDGTNKMAVHMEVRFGALSKEEGKKPSVVKACVEAEKYARRFAFIKISVGQAIKGVDEFYSDFKNMGINFHDALHVVNMQIKGTPQEDIDRLLLFLRSGDIDNLIVKDEKGKFVRLIEFP